MSVPLTKGWKLHSVNDWSFNPTPTGTGVCSFTANVKPIEPFDVRDLIQEYSRLIPRTEANVTYNVCGQEFFIHTLTIPGHFCYLSVGLMSSIPIDYQDAKDMMYKLSSLAETGYNPYGTVTIHSFAETGYNPYGTVTTHSFNDCRPWYKRIFDWFL